MPQTKEDDFSFEIIESIGQINVTERGWFKELNFVRWNRNVPKFDIRAWHPDHGKMGRGVTFTEEEIIQLGKLIVERFPDSFTEAGEKVSSISADQKTGSIKPASHEAAGPDTGAVPDEQPF